MLLLCVIIVLLLLLELVKRAERAADRAEAAARRADPTFAIVGRDSDSTVMRMAARWGADVLSLVANGTPGAEAVRRAMPRIATGLSSVPEHGSFSGGDASSDVSTDELPQAPAADPNDWVVRASNSVTPAPETQRVDTAGIPSFYGTGTTFIPGIHETRAVIRPSATAPSRPRLSPTHED